MGRHSPFIRPSLADYNARLVASVFTHSIVAVLFGKLLRRGKIPMPIWIFAILCSMAPDIDVLGLSMGVGYGDFLGHRGFTHSLCFAFILGLLVVWVGFSGAPGLVGSHWQLALFFFMITSSHGLLDAMTNGGLGVAFFSPFDTGRYFLPWRPIEVSPIGVAGEQTC